MSARYTSSKYKTLMVDGLHLKFADGAIEVSDPKHIKRLDKLVGDPRFGITRADTKADKSVKDDSTESSTEAVAKPSKADKREVWEAYAQSIDFDTDGLTKAEIIEAVG